MGRNINISKKIATGRVSVAFKLATLGVVTLAVWFSGCSREITGEWQNSPPEVRFVNIPPDGSVFSANPVINWVGTDIDGRILEYHFVVVLESDIPGGMNPEDYAMSIPLAEWTVLTVSLDTTQTSATVKLAADLNDPVNTIVQQFVFLRAKDDAGAFSPIVYRLFGRKNHFPDTRIQPFLIKPPYVNASARFQNFGGVPALWFGNDSLDFQGDQPQLEFEWLLFGPYTVAESTLIMDNFRKDVFLTNQRTYAIGDTLIDTVFDFSRTDTLIDTTVDNSVTPPDTTIDTNKTPAIDTILELLVDTANGDLDGFGKFNKVLVLDSVYNLDSILDPTGSSLRLIDQSFNPLTGETWTTQQSAIFLNLFDNDPLVQLTGPSSDTTRVRTFLFWVRSRDDATVPDPTPSFGIFNVIQPRHERDILMVDWEKAVRNLSQQGLVIPCVGSRDAVFRGGLDTSKRVMSEYLTGWLGAGTVGDGSSFIFDTTTFDPCGKDSGLVPPEFDCDDPEVKPRHSSNDYSTHGALPANISPYSLTLRDILKHKVVIFLKENLADGLPVGERSDGETWIVSGVLSGVNFWTMSRASFQERGFDNPAPFCNNISIVGLPVIYSIVFGLEGACNQGWYGMNRILGVRNEDFIGTIPSGSPGISTTEFPALKVDSLRLKNFLRWADINECPRESFAQYPFIDSVAALPAVGYIIPRINLGTEAIYLFESRFGEGRYPFFDLQTGDGNYNATVVAVRRDAGFFRVSHWEFTPLVFDTATFQVAFNSMMDWLFETWGGPPTGSGSSPVSRRTPQTMYSVGDYTLNALSNWNLMQAQEQIDELTPPGQRGVRDQHEAEIYIKKYLERKKLESQKVGF